MSQEQKDAETQAKETIAKIKEYGTWLIIFILFIIIGWPLIIEFTK